MTAELWHAGSRELWTHDVTLTAGFWGSLGFAIALPDTSHATLSLGGVALRYAVDPDVDPWSPAVARVELEVTNADLLHAELYEADVMSDGEELEEAELRARWSSTRDVSRLGAVVETGTDPRSRRRAFTVHDPTGNRIGCGHPLLPDAA